MPDWVADLSVGGALAFGVIVFAALTVVVRLWKPLRRFGHLLDDMAGEPARPGVPARAGLMERVAAVEGATWTIRSEVLPNSGTSLRDEVTRNTEGIKSAHDRIDELSDELHRHISDTET